MALPAKLFNLNVEPIVAPVALPYADEIGAVSVRRCRFSPTSGHCCFVHIRRSKFD